MTIGSSESRRASWLVLCFSIGCSSSQASTDASVDAPSHDAPRHDAGDDASFDAGVDAGTSEALGDPTDFTDVGRLSVARNGLTATVLADGRALLVGGEDVRTRSPYAAVDVFDPATDQLAVVAALPSPRSNHAAVRLVDGRVLVVGGGRAAPTGGGSGLDVLASAVVYDPARDTWDATGDLLEGRSHFGAVRLEDGRVLVVGGTAGTFERDGMCTPDCGPLGDALASAEIYDPSTGRFHATGSLGQARTLHTVERLPDGRVLAIAGMNEAREGFTSTEIFDPVTETWTAGPTLVSEARVFHRSALLPSGRVLVAGGKLPDTYFLASVDVLDIGGAPTRTAAPLEIALTTPGLVALPSGRVLSAGGFRCPSPCTPVGETWIYDESTDVWQSTGALRIARAGHAIAVLGDGRVLVCGGYSASGNTPWCEITVHD